MATSTMPDRVTVVFDGTCGFCTRSIRYLKKIDKRNQVTAEACQIVQPDPAYGLQDVDCGEAAWALTADKVEVAFFVAQPTSPAERGAKDTRVFGFGLTALTVHPL